MTRKTCTKCGIEKDEEDFLLVRGTRWRKGACRMCRAAYHKAYAAQHPEKIEAAHRRHIAHRHVERIKRRRELAVTIDGYFTLALEQKRLTCKRRGIECTLTVDDLLAAFKGTDGRCAITGAFLEWGPGPPTQDRVSIDRIDPFGGYTRENIRLVTVQANRLRRRLPDRELYELASEIRRTLGPSVEPQLPIDLELELRDLARRLRRMGVRRIIIEGWPEGVSHAEAFKDWDDD